MNAEHKAVFLSHASQDAPVVERIADALCAAGVVEAFQAQWPGEPLRYWRDKAGREVDFVRPRGREAVDAFECKWSPDEFDPAAMKFFREYYPKGDNYLLSPGSGRAYRKRAQGLELKVCGLEELAEARAWATPAKRFS